MRRAFTSRVQQYDPALAADLRRAEIAFDVEVSRDPKERLLQFEEIRTELRKALPVLTLPSINDEAIIQDPSGFHAPEDTALQWQLVQRALLSGNRTRMLDLCGGNAVVSAKAVGQGLVPSAASVDLDTERAEIYLAEQVKAGQLAQAARDKIELIAFDLRQGPDQASWSNKPDFATANPPWVPVAYYLQDHSQFANYCEKVGINPDDLYQINGGKNGLEMAALMLRYFEDYQVEKATLNVASICDISALTRMISRGSYMVESIDLLPTQTYLYDHHPLATTHITHGVQNNYYQEKKLGLKYAIIGLTLRRLGPKEKRDLTPMRALRAAMRHFAKGSIISQLAPNSEHLKVWQLSGAEEMRLNALKTKCDKALD